MNPQKLSTHGKKKDPAEDHLSSLFEELQLASKWNRPSILLAAYRSKLVLIATQIALEKKLRKIKQAVYLLQVNIDNSDIPLFLSQYPDRERTVFFVTGLMNGDGPQGLNAYRALNIRRELLVEHHIRAVFWVNEQEAATLPTLALDFWSFRHRMVELSDQSTPEQVAALVKTLNWPRWDIQELFKEIPVGLTLREKLLSEIPDWEQAPCIRAELIHMLAGLHWAQDEYKESEQLLEQGLEITQKFSLLPLQSKYWIAIGRLRYSLGNLDQSITAYQNALKLDPDSADAWGNLGIAYQDQQESSKALAAAQKSIELNPLIASSWNNLGDIQRDYGRPEDAIQAYKKSLKLNPKEALVWTKLGDVHRSQGHLADALQPFKKARQLNTKDYDIWIRLGLVYHDLGINNSAIRAFYKAARLNPLSAVPWKNLGDIYRYNSHLRSARRAYKTASLLDPNDKTVLIALGACYVRKKKNSPS
jgi:tetratricopeptide (TPR) repeat protein